MKYGLECEFFVSTKGKKKTFVGNLDHTLTPDECGFLAEARGRPHDSIREAVFSLMADIHRLEDAAKTLGLNLVRIPYADVPYDQVLESRRHFAKKTIEFQNLYGHNSHMDEEKKTAGIHISFTCQKTHFFQWQKKNEERFDYQPNWDWVQPFRYLDKAFEKEIKQARRNPGFYELKHDGRIEYRSLPNNVDLMKVITEVENAFKN